MKVDDQEEMQAQIRNILAKYLKTETSMIDMNAALVDGLGVDSLGIMEIVFEIERKYKIEIPNELFAQVKSGNDIAQQLVNHFR